MLFKVRLISVVFVTSSLDIYFLWNLFFFLFLLPAPCAAFSATICWYFFLLFLVREEGKVSACFPKLMHTASRLNYMYKLYTKSLHTRMRMAGFCDKLFRPFYTSFKIVTHKLRSKTVLREKKIQSPG